MGRPRRTQTQGSAKQAPEPAAPAQRTRSKRSGGSSSAAAVADFPAPQLAASNTSLALPTALGVIPDTGPLVCLGPLIGGVLIRRPSASCRTPYVADVQLDATTEGEEGPAAIAHAPGMDGAGMVFPGSRVFMTTNPPETVKTCTHTIQMIHDVRDDEGKLSVVGYHPTLAERIAKAAVTRGLLAEDLGVHVTLETQKTFGETRVDFVLRHADGSQTLLEVKNVTGADFQEGHVPTHRQKSPGKKKSSGSGVYTSPVPTDGTAWAPTAIFPHGSPKTGIKVVSDRAIKHIHELTQLQQRAECDLGVPTRCAVLFVVNRGDCAAFRPCDETDPLFANVVKHARDHGVRLLAHDVVLDPDTGTVSWGKRLPVVFREGVTGVVDQEHLEKVLHFNRTDPRPRWKALKKNMKEDEEEEEEEDQKKAGGGPSTPKKRAPKTGPAKGAARKKKRKATTTEEESRSSVTESE